MRSSFLICLIFLLVFSGLALAQDYGQVMGQKEITFTQYAFGNEREINPELRTYQARQQAIVDVFYQFQNWLDTLFIADKTLAEYMTEDPQLQNVITTNLFIDCRFEETIYPEGQIEVKLIRRWNGSDLALTLDRLYREKFLGSKIQPEPTSPGNDSSTGGENTGSQKDPQSYFDTDDIDYSGYTGIIIDTRGLQVRPSMAPKIFDSEMKEIYGTMAADPDFVIEVGIVGYAYDLEEAKESMRIGEHPLVISALRRTGNAKDQVVLSNEDAELLRKIGEHSELLHECRVMFVIDS